MDTPKEAEVCPRCHGTGLAPKSKPEWRIPYGKCGGAK